jgi:hypothetical protein
MQPTSQDESFCSGEEELASLRLLQLGAMAPPWIKHLAMHGSNGPGYTAMKTRLHEILQKGGF